MLTGIETWFPLVCSNTCPLNVPATKPPPGKLAGMTLTVGSDGAAPLAEEMVNQAPPSEVLVAAVQSSVPSPAFRIGSTCGGGGLPLVSIENVIWPGRASKN